MSNYTKLPEIMKSIIKTHNNAVLAIHEYLDQIGFITNYHTDRILNNTAVDIQIKHDNDFCIDYVAIGEPDCTKFFVTSAYKQSFEFNAVNYANIVKNLTAFRRKYDADIRTAGKYLDLLLQKPLSFKKVEDLNNRLRNVSIGVDIKQLRLQSACLVDSDVLTVILEFQISHFFI